MRRDAGLGGCKLLKTKDSGASYPSLESEVDGAHLALRPCIGNPQILLAHRRSRPRSNRHSASNKIRPNSLKINDGDPF
jgi:hypothetical protein